MVRAPSQRVQVSLKDRTTHFLFGSEPRLRRMLRYWVASGVFYFVCIGMIMLQIQVGTAERAAASLLCAYAALGALFFFGLVRVSVMLRIAPVQLAVIQGLFAISCNVGAYMVTGPLRGASLMVLLVVIVFCTFSLRPRQSLMLCATAIGALAVAMCWLVARYPLAYPVHIEAIHFGLATSSLVAVTLLTGEMSKLRSRLKRQKEELLAAVTTIRTLATVDELTSLANRRHMNDVLSAEERRQGGSERPICIALLDIDFFKNVNDRYGHAGGDAVLRAFAAAVRAELRTADVLARWGGEEFLLLLPDTELDAAVLVLRRMAQRLSATCIPELDLELRITFSAGVVVRPCDEPFADTITRADKAMYTAKSAGRNRIIPA